MKKTRLPADMAQKAKMVVDIATGEAQIVPTSYLAQIGRNGGKKGGPARAKTLTSERRSEIAKNAAAARWGKSKP